MLHTIHQPIVNLIREDQQIVSIGQSGYLEQPLAWHNRASWVIRVANQNRARAGCDRRLNRRSGYLERILDRGRNRNRRTARKNHAGRVGDKTWLGNDYLIAGVDRREHRVL